MRFFTTTTDLSTFGHHNVQIHEIDSDTASRMIDVAERLRLAPKTPGHASEPIAYVGLCALLRSLRADSVVHFDLINGVDLHVELDADWALAGVNLLTA